MKSIFQTKNQVLPVHSTGRGCLEASITNLFSPGDEIASVCNGKFGEMYASIAETFGLRVHRVSTDWERDFDPDELKYLLAHNPGIKAVTVTHNETATAVANDVKLISEIAHQYDAIILVDTISSLGGIEFSFDKWDIDLAVTATQKALMGPTGMSFAVLGPRAWSLTEKASIPHNYFDFQSIMNKVNSPQPQTPGSTPALLVAAMEKSSELILEEGMEKVWERHSLISDVIKSCLISMGLTLFPENISSRSTTTTAFRIPERLDMESIVKDMKDLYGITIKGGLGKYQKEVIRLGHMGNFFLKDALILVSSVETVMNHLGSLDTKGNGIITFNKKLKEYF